ncbi:MAG: hypothetical protein HDR97_01615 [Bacteroides sp.]|nr:hypothetical protein [Bacteroides sp.]
MRNFARIAATLVLSATGLWTVSCGGDEGFTVTCEIDGLGDHGVEMVYATDRGLSHTSHHPKDGKVELHGNSSVPTPVDIFTIDGSLIATLVMKNGEKARVTMELGVPRSLKVEGQSASRDYTAFVVEHDSLLRHGSPATVNRLIASFVKDNPSSIASTMLMVNKFITDGYELSADSLLSSIEPEARPRLLTGSWASGLGEQVSPGARRDMRMFTMNYARDTFARYTPGLQGFALLAFTEGVKPDSLTAELKALRRDLPRRRFMMMEISVDPDSATWRRNIAPDSAVAATAPLTLPADSVSPDSTDSAKTKAPALKTDSGKGKAPEWIQAWSPGGVASTRMRRLAVPRTPYYIIADSTGTVRYRGSSLEQAGAFLRKINSARPRRSSTPPAK